MEEEFRTSMSLAADISRWKQDLAEFKKQIIDQSQEIEGLLRNLEEDVASGVFEETLRKASEKIEEFTHLIYDLEAKISEVYGIELWDFPTEAQELIEEYIRLVHKAPELLKEYGRIAYAKLHNNGLSEWDQNQQDSIEQLFKIFVNDDLKSRVIASIDQILQRLEVYFEKSRRLLEKKVL